MLAVDFPGKRAPTGSDGLAAQSSGLPCVEVQEGGGVGKRNS